MKAGRSRRQRGVSLLVLLLALAIGASWFVVSQLNADSGNMTAYRKSKNAEVLRRAKQALIGYVAAQADKAGENNPGAMPCPENPGDFNSTSGNDGKIGTGCGGTTVGRFPWRSLGLDKLVDASGEPLWYVVSPGWGLASSSSNTDINSNSTGQLTVDGVANAAVALIIAPGPAFSVTAATGCTAWNQVRPTTGTPDWRNYLECDNATSPADASFVTTGPSASFNDQVMVVTVADVMPAIEAAIADRINREIVPALNTVFTGATWGFAGSNPVYPFAAPFANPGFNTGAGSNTGTSNYQGVAGTYQGLLPFNQTQGCAVSASNPRCTSTLLTFAKTGSDAKTGGSGSIRTQSTCAWQSSVYVCTGQYNQPSISLSFSFNVTNVAMGLRALDFSQLTCTAVDDVGNGIPTQTVACTTSVALQSNGSATFTVSTATLPDIASSGWGTFANYMININSAFVGDHSLLDTTNTTTGWFARNEWYRLAYYAVAQRYTAGTLPPSCTTGTNCLSVTNVTPAGAQRAILILAGSALNGATRPSSTLANYLEGGNATGAYLTQTIRSTAATPAAQRFNDRVVVIGSN